VLNCLDLVTIIVEDFSETYGRMTAAGVEFLGQPRAETSGQVVVFVDIAGNRWDLLGPPTSEER